MTYNNNYGKITDTNMHSLTISFWDWKNLLKKYGTVYYPIWKRGSVELTKVVISQGQIV